MSTRQLRRKAQRERQKIARTLWQPLQETQTIRKGDGTLAPVPDGERWYGNNKYSACLRIYTPDDPDNLTVLHISYHRRDRSAARDWREAQMIKNDIVGPEQEMVELYPAESRIVDMANEFHMWGFAGVPMVGLGFNDGRQVEVDPDLAVQYPGAQQRPNPNETDNEGESSE